MSNLYIVTLLILTYIYIMQNARLDEAQAEIKIARGNINNFRYADNTSLIAIIFITSTIVWPQVKQQGGNTALPSNRKFD